MERCAAHPDATSTGRCEACPRPFCAACAVEDVASDLFFCSDACRESQALVSRASVDAPTSAELIDGLWSPIRTGWELWWREAPALTLRVGLPVGAAGALLQLAARSTGWVEGLVIDLAHLGLAGLAAAAVGVILSRSRTGVADPNPWPQVAARFLPWSLAWLALAVCVVLGSLLFLIPGAFLGLRLFWADELCLVHGRGPIAAARESWALTEGLTRTLFAFQFLAGLALYLVLAALGLGWFGVTVVLDFVPPGSVGLLISGFAWPFLLVHAYAASHAPEVAYFYGLRALRAELPPEGRWGDWVARARQGAIVRPDLPVCPHCDRVWDPDDYRRDAEAIYCSYCKEELSWPDAEEASPSAGTR